MRWMDGCCLLSIFRLSNDYKYPSQWHSAKKKKTLVARRSRAASSEPRPDQTRSRNAQPANANPGLATSLRWRAAFPVMRSNVHICRVCTLTGRSVFGEGGAALTAYWLRCCVCYHGKSLVAGQLEPTRGTFWIFLAKISSVSSPARHSSMQRTKALPFLITYSSPGG